MFPKHKKSHEMRLRKTEKFKISNAKHARLARSAIPDMQRHINMNHQEQKKHFQIINRL